MNFKYTPLAAAILLVACTSPRLTEETRQYSMKAIDRTSLAAAAVGDNASEATRGSSAYADKLAQEQANMPVMRRSKSAWLGSQMVPVTNDDKLPLIFKKPFTLSFDDKKVGRSLSLDMIVARLNSEQKVAIRVQPDVYTSSAVNAMAQASVSSSAGLNPPIPPGGIPRVLQPGGAPNGAVNAQAGSASATVSAGSAQASVGGAVPQMQGQSVMQSPMVNTVDMNWSGTLTGFLNHLTDRLGLSWEYRDNTIVIMRFVTESHEIATFNGKTKYDMATGGGTTGQGGANGASTDANSKLSVTDSGDVDPVTSIERSIVSMMASVPGSAVTRSDGSNRLVVKTSREMQSQVRDFIKAENESMLRQTQIQFDIYSVRTNDADERGVDWNMVLNTLSNMYSLRVASPATLTGATSGGVTFNILQAGAGNNSATAQRFGGSAAMINLLNQVGDNVQHRPVSLLGLNRTWARKSKLSTVGYLSETTPGPANSVAGIGAPGLKTSSVTTGDQYVALPQILDNNTILLKFGISLSDLLGLFDVTSGQGLNQQKVQVPNIQAINDQSVVALKPGQTMVITGLSRLVSTSDQRTLAENAPVGLGGSRKLNLQREHFIIFVRPVILQ